MAKDINLTSQQWNDIIFEGKNKDYGAYEMRQSSSKRHIIAFLSILLVAIFVAVVPALASKVKEWVKHRTESLTGEVEIKNIMDKPEDEQQEMIEELAIPDPLLTTIAFVAPEIVDEVAPGEELETMENLQETNVQISIMTVEGSLEKGAIDIAELEKQLAIAGVEKGKIWDVVEILPEYPGGEGELDKYLRSNIVYPRIARDNLIEGRVMVRFVVRQDGSISDVTIQRSPHKSLSDEAIRVVKTMPKWLPGKQNGKAVNVYFVLPIDFKLN